MYKYLVPATVTGNASCYCLREGFEYEALDAVQHLPAGSMTNTQSNRFFACMQGSLILRDRTMY